MRLLRVVATTFGGEINHDGSSAASGRPHAAKADITGSSRRTAPAPSPPAAAFLCRCHRPFPRRCPPYRCRQRRHARSHIACTFRMSRQPRYVIVDAPSPIVSAVRHARFIWPTTFCYRSTARDRRPAPCLPCLPALRRACRAMCVLSSLRASSAATIHQHASRPAASGVALIEMPCTPCAPSSRRQQQEAVARAERSEERAWQIERRRLQVPVLASQ